MAINENKAKQEIENFFNKHNYNIEVIFREHNKFFNKQKSKIFIIYNNRNYHVDLMGLTNMNELLEEMVEWWNGDNDIAATMTNPVKNPKKIEVNSFSELVSFKLMKYTTYNINFSLSELLEYNKEAKYELDLNYLSKILDVEMNLLVKNIMKSIEKEKYLPRLPEDFEKQILDLNMKYFKYMTKPSPGTILKAIEDKSNIQYIDLDNQFDKTLVQIILKLNNSVLDNKSINKLYNSYIEKFDLSNFEKELKNTILYLGA